MAPLRRQASIEDVPEPSTPSLIATLVRRAVRGMRRPETVAALTENLQQSLKGDRS